MPLWEDCQQLARASRAAYSWGALRPALAKQTVTCTAGRVRGRSAGHGSPIAAGLGRSARLSAANLLAVHGIAARTHMFRAASAWGLHTLDQEQEHSGGTHSLSGVYLAMLTLAFAQIVWSVAFQWDRITGGSNGLVGIWPAAWLSDRRAFFYLSLVLCGLGIWLLRRIIFSPFGYALRAVRDSALRAEAIGIDSRRTQWLGFAVAGLFAGVAGSIYAFSKGSISPETLGIGRSVDGLLMVLLGGVQSLSGPFVGAAAFIGLNDELARLTQYWRAALGVVIIVLVVAFPQGIVGFIDRKLGRAAEAEGACRS